MRVDHVGVGNDLLARNVVDPQHVQLCLNARDLFIDLLKTLRKRAIPRSKTVLVDRVRVVEFVQLVDLCSEPDTRLAECGESALLLFELGL